jgi:hypothetical protein
MGIQPTVSKMGPIIAVGSVKAQGSKANPISGLELPREIKVRDEETQRVANILAHLGTHRGDPVPSSFVSEPRPGGFLHAPLWAGI